MQHFDVKGKHPSSYAIELQKALRRSLPSEYQRDFEAAQHGFLVAPDYKQIMEEAGNKMSITSAASVVWCQKKI